MPRLTYQPGSDSPARCASRFRFYPAWLRRLRGFRRRADGALLNALFVALALENALHENPRRVNFIGVEGPFRHQFLDLGNGDFAGHGHHGVEIPRRRLVDEVAGSIALSTP